ncbi:hypothetical protein AB0J80_36990 [Actinoplanes sp. NPDC049548]|uniref:hypothetical protein n=1 Tax=Actinoplanes sp. NPDC049548 TaxID=3155152 RepID=UPI00341D0D8D
MELIAAPRGTRELRQDLEELLSMGRVDTNELRTCDGSGEVRDAAVAPPSDLVAEQARAAQQAVTYRPLSDHTPVVSCAAPDRGHLDGVQVTAYMDPKG